MPTHPTNDPSPQSTHELIELMRCVCGNMGIAFSANDVNRSLSDFLATDGTDVEFAKFEFVGARLGIRFRKLNSSFRELVKATSSSFPLVAKRTGQTDGVAGGYLLLLPSHGRSRCRVFVDGVHKTVSRSWLKRELRTNEEGDYEWFLAQPILAAAAASSFHFPSASSGKPLKPLTRLLAMLKPESKDIRVLVVFSTVIGILSLTTPLAVEAVVNTIAFGRYLQPLIILSLIVFVFLAFRAGLSVLMSIVVEIIQRSLFVRVVDDLAHRLIRVPMTHLKKYHGTELVNRFFDIVNVQKVVSKLLLDTLLLILQTAIGLMVLAFYHPFLLGYDIGLIVMMAVVLVLIGRGAVETAKQESACKYATAAWLQELVRHPTLFKFGGSMEFAVTRADELSAAYIHQRSGHFHIVVRQVAFSALMQAIAATVLLGLGGYLVIVGQLTIGQLVAAELIVSVILGSFAKIGRDLESFYDLLASVDKLGKLFDLPIESGDRLHLNMRDEASELELVELKFKGGPAIKHQKIAPATTVAIVGPAGSGKSRLIESLAGQYTPDSGYVLLNGFRVDSLSLDSLQLQTGFIRDIEIFDDTIDENIRLSRSNVSSNYLNELVEQVGLRDEISRLEQGLATQVKISGYPLSTTASIRLTIARSLAARPKLLLIDGLLDRLSDDDIDDMLARLNVFKSETTIVIATGRQAIANWADVKIDCDFND